MVLRRHVSARGHKYLCVLQLFLLKMSVGVTFATGDKGLMFLEFLCPAAQKGNSVFISMRSEDGSGMSWRFARSGGVRLDRPGRFQEVANLMCCPTLSGGKGAYSCSELSGYGVKWTHVIKRREMRTKEKSLKNCLLASIELANQSYNRFWMVS